MANFFNRNQWNPIRHGYYPQAQIQPQSTKPKIINIPVHFIGSDDATSKQSPAPGTVNAAASAVPTGEASMAAAVTIQRAVRGFLVRKNARLVRQVAAEVEEIERKVKGEEANIRLNARDRLLVSETLMALLLRLDSVRGVRDLRKRVIRRVISLQEEIDSICAAADGAISTINKAENQEGSRDEASEDSSIDYEKTPDPTSNLDEDETELGMENPAAVESPKRNIDQIATAGDTIFTSGTAEDREVSMINITEEASIDQEKEAKKTLDLAEDQEGSVEGTEESSIYHEKSADQTIDLIEGTNEGEAKLEVVVESPKRKIEIEIGEDGSRSPEQEEEKYLKAAEGASPWMMVEKMALENEKLKGMVAQLCATSSEQCRLMKGLADRVEKLERVVHHRMDRRKKRRSSAACSAFSSAK